MAHSPASEDTSAVPEASEKAARAPLGADPEKRKRILGAAVQTFGRRGFHEARIAEIAASAGVAEGTVYLYFKNKEDLLGVVFDETMDGVLAKAEEIRCDGSSAAEKLTKLVDLHISFLSADRDLASVFQIELRRSARFVERFSRSKLVSYLKLLDGICREGMATGEFRADLDPNVAVRILFGAADDVLSDWLMSGRPAPVVDGGAVVGTLLHGFIERKDRPGKGRAGSGRPNARRAAARTATRTTEEPADRDVAGGQVQPSGKRRTSS